MTVRITLSDTLQRLEKQGVNMTKNKIAVESKTRPSTLSDLFNGKTKAIKLDTLDDILNAMNRLYPEGNFTIEDIVNYEQDQKIKEQKD
ncbi:helix-turn-helix domain-containing protein [Paenisporosarcina sp. NPDC076898]|uniref:helix-turn-helix domain-containing protein n=1 Tax=unclassified Paenisporosarcina TaxID=2642018 RepID=UPI003CFFF34D